MVAKKTGALSRDELMQLWESVVSPEYAEPLKRNESIEFIEQMAEQFALVSSIVDRNTQSMFLNGWSGQSADPASGESYATVDLTLTRNSLFELPIVFTQDVLEVEHVLNDYGENGPIEVSTGRFFKVRTTTVLMPGQRGPITLSAIASKPGAGYNLPTEGTLNRFYQPGVGFNNSGASVVNGESTENSLITSVFPDVPITEHIGRYIKFIAGANNGRYARILGVERATVEHGGVFKLAAETLLAVGNPTGTFISNENVYQDNSAATGVFLGLSNNRILILRKSGVFGPWKIHGETSNASITPSAGAFKLQSETLNAETGTAGWVVVDWKDLGISITNEAQPSGGKSGMLDALGSERALPRFYNENDETYRARISRPADVVSPAAVIRAANRVLSEYEDSACLREVGYPKFKGLFFDGAPNQDPFAFGLDLVPITISTFSSYIDGEVVSAVNSQGVITSGIIQYEYVSGTINRLLKGISRVTGPGFEPMQTLIGSVSGEIGTIATVGGNVRAEHRFFVNLDIYESRGFFIVGVPRISDETYIMAYDVGENGAFDTNKLSNFFDGSQIGGNTTVYARVWNAIDKVRPAGVPFDLYIEEVGCV